MQINTTYTLIKKQITDKFVNTKQTIKDNKNNIKLLIIIIILFIIIFGIILILLIISKSATKKDFFLHDKNKNSTLLVENYTATIENYLSSIPEKYERAKQRERFLLNLLYSLKDLSKDPDDPHNNELKSKLVSKMTKFTNGKNFSKVKAVLITRPMHYGNYMVMVNMIMYYCELFGIKKIYFDSHYNWYLKNDIITDKYNISIIPIEKINCNDSNIVCFPLRGNHLFGFFYYPSFIKPQIRIHILKYEIRKNLPNVTIGKDDLLIHVRSGNIFKSFHRYYAQPPLCFYRTILNNFKFKKIILIAITKDNPTINPLLKEFPKIIYKRNPIDKDLAYLTNAYNLVGSVSSFLMTAMKLNDNLKNYWDYDIYRRSEKICHLNVEYYDFPRKFRIYQMKPSVNYKNEMFVWSNDTNKFRLMINERCINNFTIIEPNA